MLISEESMTRLGVVLRLRDKVIDIEDLQLTGGKLDFHPKSGHPVARLLPTVKNRTAGAAPKNHFIGETVIDIEDEGDSELDEVHYVNLKQRVRRRFVGLPTAAAQVPKRHKRRL